MSGTRRSWASGNQTADGIFKPKTLPNLKYLNTFQVMASEDAAFFLERVPGVFILVGSANSERNLDYPHHHPKFDFDEEALVIGASLVARAVSEFLGERDRKNRH